MLNRFLFITCVLVFFGYLGHKIWHDNSINPQVLVEALHAHEQHLDGSGITVVVIDEGFDDLHSALKANFSPFQYNTDHSTRDVSESITYENGRFQIESHGTHVSGIIASIAPCVKIIPIKVGGFGGDQSFVKALKLAATTKAHVVNISMKLTLTGREIGLNVRSALTELANSGKLIVIAAGNDNISMLETAYTSSLVELSQDPQIKGRLLIVGASTYEKGKEKKADFSNYPGLSFYGNPNKYFITAPGDKIISTITGSKYGEKSGTSMATPIVVGAASILKQAYPHLLADQIAILLLNSARRVSLDGKELPTREFGAGIVNLKSALELGKTI
jgi:subtilisin family serine protease